MAQETELGGYRIIGRLAVGGMAEIYQAQAGSSVQRSPGEPDEVALKRLLPSYRNDGSFVKQFVDEAKLSVRLRHPNIVRTFRCFKAGDDYLMVQELVSGRTLGYMQDLLFKAGTPMPLAAATYIVYCVLQALDYLHRGKLGEAGATIVHRDVNPANILLSVGGDVKLTDFGVADVEGASRRDAGALRGTLSYMSPEQVLGQQVDQRSDLYSVGIVLWELFTNKRLFPGETELEIMHKVRNGQVPPVPPSTGLPFFATQLVRRALFSDRSLRFQSALDFGKALEMLARRSGWPLTVDALRPLLGG